MTWLCGFVGGLQFAACDRFTGRLERSVHFERRDRPTGELTNRLAPVARYGITAYGRASVCKSMLARSRLFTAAVSA